MADTPNRDPPQPDPTEPQPPGEPQEPETPKPGEPIPEAGLIDPRDVVHLPANGPNILGPDPGGT